MIDMPVHTPSLHFSSSGATVWEDDGMCDCICMLLTFLYSPFVTDIIFCYIWERTI